jgi:ATP-dependent Clp protease protease subunit
MEIQANQIRHMRSRFEALFARATGQTEARIKADTKRDFWLNTDAALSYGLVGRVIASVTELS